MLRKRLILRISFKFQCPIRNIEKRYQMDRLGIMSLGTPTIWMFVSAEWGRLSLKITEKCPSLSIFRIKWVRVYKFDDISIISLVFHSQKFDKLHIEMLDCPKLLATKLLRAFPRYSVQAESLRIIKLSYHKYRDQNKGKLDVSFESCDQ